MDGILIYLNRNHNIVNSGDYYANKRASRVIATLFIVWKPMETIPTIHLAITHGQPRDTSTIFFLRSLNHLLFKSYFFLDRF